jgi:hypothetical protein
MWLGGVFINRDGQRLGREMDGDNKEKHQKSRYLRIKATAILL